MKIDKTFTLAEDQILIERVDKFAGISELSTADPDDDGTGENDNQTNDKG